MIRRIHHVGIVVKRLTEAYAFYRDVLGLPLVREAEIAEQGVRAALLAAGLALAFTALRNTTRATGAAEAEARRAEQLRAAQGFLRRQLEGALAMPVETPRPGEELVVFEAGPDLLRFVAPMPGYLSRGGPYVQTFRIRRGAGGLRIEPRPQGTETLVRDAVDAMLGLAARKRQTLHTDLLDPQVVVLDVSMPDLGGAEAAEQIHGCCPGARILALTRYADQGYLRRLLDAGARGYVLKRTAGDALIDALARLTATLAGYERRQDDWDFQAEQAKAELRQLEAQMVAAELRLAVAKHELSQHDRQVAHSEEVADFLRTKFTSDELYGWMIGQLSALYFQSYKLAHDMARRAEAALGRELDATFAERFP